MPGTVKKLQFSEGTDVGAPTDLSLATSTSVIISYPNDAAYVVGEGAPGDGSCYFNTTIKKFRFYVSGDWRNCLPEMDPADPTKLILVDITGNSTGVTSTLLTANTANRVYTFPDVSMTVAGRANAETLQNKTLQNPLISGGSIDVASAGNLNIGATVGANNITLGASTSTVIVSGDLQVDGTTTTVNSATLDVTDANVTVNNGGNDASAEGAGLTVDRTGTSGSIAYENALPSKWKAGDLGAEEEIVTTMHVQSVQKKRLRLDTVAAANDSTSPRIVLPQNTLANLQAISGANHPQEGAVYWATDVNAAYAWDGTALVPLATESKRNVGLANYASNENINSVDFEADLTGWSTYDDGAVAVPVNGTGGSPSVVSISRNSSSPLRGGYDLKISKSAADGQGEGAVLDFNIPRGYRYGQISQATFLLNTNDANFADGDVAVYLYDVTNSILITPTNSSLPSGYSGLYKVYFTQNNGSAYRLVFHVTSTNANAYDVFVDDIFVGPGDTRSIPNVEEYETSTTFDIDGTVSAPVPGVGYAYRRITQRIGAWAHIRWQFSQPTGGGAGSGNYLLVLPAGLNLDPLKHSYGGASTGGSGVGLFSGSGGGYNVILNAYDSKRFEVNLFPSAGGQVIWNTTNENINAGAIDMEVEAYVPILEWRDNTSMFTESSQVEYSYNSGTWDADDTTSFAYGSSGAAIPGALTAIRQKRVKFLSEILSTDKVVLEFSTDGISWFEAGSATLNGNPTTGFVINDGGTVAGVALEGFSSTEVDIYFYTNQWKNIGGAAQAWTSGFWRVYKSHNPIGVGFNLAHTDKVGLAPKGVFRANQDYVVDLQNNPTTPANPDMDVEAKIYLKGNKFIIQYNDSGTVRYKYLDLTGTGVTWTHTTSAP